MGRPRAIHGRRQIGTTARLGHRDLWRGRRCRPADPHRLGQAVSSRSTSTSDRTARASTGTPAATSASWSSRRFSSSSRTTRSGARPTMAAEVGVLGPAHGGQVGLLAEPGAGDRVDPPGPQRLGHGRDEAHHAHRPTVVGCTSTVRAMTGDVLDGVLGRGRCAAGRRGGPAAAHPRAPRARSRAARHAGDGAGGARRPAAHRHHRPARPPRWWRCSTATSPGRPCCCAATWTPSRCPRTPGSTTPAGSMAPCTRAATTPTRRCSPARPGCWQAAGARSGAGSCSCSSPARRATPAPRYMLDEGLLATAAAGCRAGVDGVRHPPVPDDPVRDDRHQGPAADGVGRRVRDHRPGQGRPRVDAAPRRRPDPDRGRDRRRPPVHGHPPRRRLRPGRRHRRQDPGRHDHQRHPGDGHAAGARSAPCRRRPAIAVLADLERVASGIAAAHGATAEVEARPRLPRHGQRRRRGRASRSTPPPRCSATTRRWRCPARHGRRGLELRPRAGQRGHGLPRHPPARRGAPDVAPNHSNRMVLDEAAMAAGVATYAGVALRWLAGTG